MNCDEPWSLSTEGKNALVTGSNKGIGASIAVLDFYF